ncbi:hypothetical protein ACLOJK_016769 [Asimina triloba]
METVVVIVGAGPSGLATAACLNLHSIPNIILERDDCHASLWRKRAYDRLNLHLAKEFCHLPHMPHPSSSPVYIPKKDFINYIDQYVTHFKLSPLYRRSVESAEYDEASGRWAVKARNLGSDEVEEYRGRFLVVASGENSKGFIPDVPGLAAFTGKIAHSSQYKSGSEYSGKAVLVVGSGNSGMEIAYDLCNHGAKTSIVIRSPLHVLTRDLVRLGMTLLRYSPCYVVDALIVMLRKFIYGDLSEYGIRSPTKGPFYLKASTGRSPVIDVGTVDKIKSAEIQVLPGLSSVRGSEAVFADGKAVAFDAIVFATGYRSTAKSWLKDGDYFLDNNGMPRSCYPNHWKGEKGLYCAGLARRGLAGVSMDAQNIADDIKKVLDAVTKE